jgi:hypothetical protein
MSSASSVPLLSSDRLSFSDHTFVIRHYFPFSSSSPFSVCFLRSLWHFRSVQFTFLITIATAALSFKLIPNNLNDSFLLFTSLFSFVLFIVILFRCPLEFRVTSLPPFGVEFSTRRLFSQSKRFIPGSSIHRFLIYEGFRNFKIEYFLSAVVRQANSSSSFSFDVGDEIVLFFPNSSARYSTLHRTSQLLALHWPSKFL